MLYRSAVKEQVVGIVEKRSQVKLERGVEEEMGIQIPTPEAEGMQDELPFIDVYPLRSRVGPAQK